MECVIFACISINSKREVCGLWWIPAIPVFHRLFPILSNIIHFVFPQQSVSSSIVTDFLSQSCCITRLPSLLSLLSPQDPNILPLLGGGLVTLASYHTPSTGAWRPHKTFAVHRSTHPLDVACSTNILQDIYQSCLKEESSIVARLPWHQLLIVTSKDSRRLLSYSSPISDSIMTFYLEKLTQYYNITYLATSFLYTLRSQGWNRLKSYFAGHRNRPRTNSRPLISGESTVILPCFVDGCHWVVVHRKRNYPMLSVICPILKINIGFNFTQCCAM